MVIIAGNGLVINLMKVKACMRNAVAKYQRRKLANEIKIPD